MKGAEYMKRYEKKEVGDREKSCMNVAAWRLITSFLHFTLSLKKSHSAPYSPEHSSQVRRPQERRGSINANTMPPLNEALLESRSVHVRVTYV